MNENFVVKNSDDFYDFFVKICKFDSEKAGKYTRYYVNPDFGEGYIEQIQFKNGIELCITNLQLKKSIGFEYNLSNPPLEINYMLDGNLFNEEEQSGSMNLSRESMSVYIRSEMKGIVKFVEGRKIKYITIISNQEFMDEYFCDDSQKIELINFSKSNGAIELTKPEKPKSEIKHIFKQMSDCEFSDASKMMYLQSKSIEALSLILEQNLNRQAKQDDLLFLDKEAKQSIEKARQIIEENIVEPYTISYLAQSVFLNEYKLKKGFKQVYNMTIFEYLKHVRMLKAKELLSEKDMNVGQIACAVGYTNASHFAKNFREIYGANPKNFQFGA